jgi:hypothetical protein
MSDCTDPKSQETGGAFPGEQGTNTGAVQVNVNQDPMSIFNPNLALAAMQTYNTFNNVVNQMFGIEARWFRAIPQQRSKDVIFQEYTLSCVDDTPLCLKVMVNDGNFPDNKYQFDLMGLEYEVPTEVQLDKKYWESIAGFGTAPQKKDIVYLVLPNKLYQVESSYLKRGFMEQETTWIVNLKKYSPEASRREGDMLKETIDKYTVSEAEIFGAAILSNIEKLVDDKQMSPFNSTSKDFYKTLDKTLQIIPYNLEIGGVIAAQSYYDLSSSTLFNAVTYKDSIDDISPINDRGLTAWIYPRTPDPKEYDIIWIQKDLTITPPANYKIKVSGAKRFAIGDYFTIFRAGSLNFYAKVIDDSNSNSGIYWCKIDSEVEIFLNSINQNWISAKNYKMKLQNPINIIDGINDTTHGLKVSVYANQYVKITYGSNEYIIAMDSKLSDNQWYGVVVNIGNSWSQYNVQIWKSSNSNFGDKLLSVFTKTISVVSGYTISDSYTINKSDAYLSNIRLFRTTIEDEKQQTELLSYFSKDADQAIILDNVEPKFSPSYISRQR